MACNENRVEANIIVNPRYRDGRLPKNKDQSKFIEECQEMNKTKTYLKQKMAIKSNFEELRYAKDLPNDHIFGVKNEIEHDIKGIIQNDYDVKVQQAKFETVTQDYKPQLSKYNLKPPRDTKTNNLRVLARQKIKRSP